MAEPKEPLGGDTQHAFARDTQRNGRDGFLRSPRVRGLRQYQKQQTHESGGAVPKGAGGPAQEELAAAQQDVRALDGYFEQGLDEGPQKGRWVVEAAPAGKVAVRPAPSEPSVSSEPSETLNPYQRFVAELSSGQLQALLSDSSATLQLLLLQNASRAERTKLLRQMPQEQRTAMLRSLARDCQSMDGNAYSNAFHWLQRQVERRQYQTLGLHATESLEAGEDYREVSGPKVLSLILDSLSPEQEEVIVRGVVHNDVQLARWLERDRGSLEQRRALRQICAQVDDLELAVLFSIPRYARLIRHLLNYPKLLDIVHASIDLAGLPEQKRSELQDELQRELLQNFPVLQEC